MKRQPLTMLVAAVFVIGPVFGRAEDSHRNVSARNAAVAKPNLRTTGQKRQWLREQVQIGARDANQVRLLQARIDQLKVKQVHALADSILAQQLPRDNPQGVGRAQLQQLRAQTLRRVLSDQLAWRNFNQVGYLPIITWLPQGTSLGAGAVVSPDGRYVRINAAPMYSSVGPVYTYNLRTGETRLWPPDTSYPREAYRPLGTPPQNVGYRQGQMSKHHLPPPPPSAYPDRVWHDGLRTRVGPRR